jgi:hypothetical protein
MFRMVGSLSRHVHKRSSTDLQSKRNDHQKLAIRGILPTAINLQKFWSGPEGMAQQEAWFRSRPLVFYLLPVRHSIIFSGIIFPCQQTPGLEVKQPKLQVIEAPKTIRIAATKGTLGM